MSGQSTGAAPGEATPFATVIASGGRLLLAAVDPIAAAAGLMPGMPLADARSFVPGLATAAAEPAEDRAALTRLAEWCGRYSPWTAPDGADGIKLEITGCAHLWGGEGALAADLAGRLSRQHVGHRIAIAGSLGAAWALARFAASASGAPIVPSDRIRDALVALPVEALRLDPATCQGLRRVGLKRIGELYPMPRDALARRFGESMAARLDQATGELPEPLSPLGETPTRRVRLSFAEPIADTADLARAAERLAQDLVHRLAREGMGVRRLDLGFHRIDGRVEHIRVGTARPNRDPAHLAKLFAARLDTVDPGLGVEDVILAAFAIERLEPEQIALAGAGAAIEGSGIAPLVDQLGVKLGPDAISRLETRASHIPERASVAVVVGKERSDKHLVIPGRLRPRSGMTSGNVEKSPLKPPRPVRLLMSPEPIEAFWLLPDDPPFRFVWRRRRHRVAHADGPERIAAEWWRPEGPDKEDAIRDYYQVEDGEGRRFWLFRAGLPGEKRPPRWFVHGVFA